MCRHVRRDKEAAASRGELPPLLAPGDPAEEQKRALSVQGGGAGLETLVNSLAGDAEDSSEFHLLSAPAKEGSRLSDQLVPQRRGRSGPQRLSNAPPALLSGRHEPSGGAEGGGGGFEQGKPKRRRKPHLGREVRIHRGWVSKAR